MKILVRPHRSGARKFVGSITTLLLNNQNLRQLYLLVSVLLSVTFSACGQSSLAKRWQVAGRLENGKLVPHKSKSMDYEFTSGGRFNLYENGAITETGTYTLASDKKSVLIKDNGKGISGTIIKLTATELNIRFKGSSDTIICYAMGSSVSNAAQKSSGNYRAARKYWQRLHSSYTTRSSMITSAIYRVRYTDKSENPLFNQLSDLEKQIERFQYREELGNLTKADYQFYDAVQAKIGKAIPDLISYLREKHPEINSSGLPEDKQTLADYVQFHLNENAADIKVNKSDFEKAFNQYQQ